MQRRDFISGLVAFSIIPRAYASSSWRLPDLEGYTKQGKYTRLSEFYGQRMLVHAWAADCAPCIGDIPYIKKLEKEKGIFVLGLYCMREDLDTEIQRIQKIERTYNHEAENILLPEKAQIELRIFYQNHTEEDLALPAYFLINKDNECTYTQLASIGGKKAFQNLEKKIKNVK